LRPLTAKILVAVISRSTRLSREATEAAAVVGVTEAAVAVVVVVMEAAAAIAIAEVIGTNASHAGSGTEKLGKTENRWDGELGNRRTGEPENRRTGEPENW
jgi:hypothetical protein